MENRMKNILKKQNLAGEVLLKKQKIWQVKGTTWRDPFKDIVNSMNDKNEDEKHLRIENLAGEVLVKGTNEMAMERYNQERS